MASISDNGNKLKQIFVLMQFVCIGILAFFSELIALDVILILQIAAIIFGIWAVRSVGQNNWSVYPVPNLESSITRVGPYKFVRHPMYTSLIFFFLPPALRANSSFSWIVYSVLVITLILKIHFEERQLLKKHPEYSEFKKSTKKRVIPFLW
ncbi:MAG: isoprenylcysteine carboxylmethyltransferase family protein [Bacteroidia bacterium]|nr:isoprenylcysteine carboxylmethyltransferase family protein [Bacteroidia bacterium]